MELWLELFGKLDHIERTKTRTRTKLQRQQLGVQELVYDLSRNQKPLTEEKIYTQLLGISFL
jgi:hypothetical protein